MSPLFWPGHLNLYLWSPDELSSRPDGGGGRIGLGKATVYLIPRESHLGRKLSLVPFRINPRLLTLGSRHGADKVVGHRKELFLWALAFECGMENHPALRTPQSGGCLTPLGIKFPV